MNDTDRKFLRAQLARLDANEQKKLYKRAVSIRKAAPKPTQRRTPESGLDEDDQPMRIKHRNPGATLDDIVVRLLREEPAPIEGGELDVPFATVLELHKGRCEVDFDGLPISCVLSPEIERAQQTEIAVGDHVVLERRVDRDVVVRVLPRRTKLSRPDPDSIHRERVIVANIDVVIVVVSVVSPPLHPRLIDRYLIAAHRGGAEAAVLVNKLDLLEDATELEALEPYRAAGIRVIHCSSDTAMGIDKVRELIAGRRGAFVGHSGVGKSSIVRAILPEVDIEVGAVSAGYGRGTHTTRRSTLYRLGEGSEVIDTPGIRAFGLWRLDADELAWHFPEFSQVSCRFRDCSHRHEPGCGVREAVERGEILEERYDTFLRLAEGV